MACIPPNPRRVGYIDPIHGPLYMGSKYSNSTNWNILNETSCQVEVLDCH